MYNIHANNKIITRQNQKCMFFQVEFIQKLASLTHQA